MTENQTLGPRGWVSGWIVTLLAGLAISTFWGVAAFDMRQALFRHDLAMALLGLISTPVALVTPIDIGAFVFALVFATPSITLSCVVVRLLLRSYKPSLVSRVVLGLTLGTFTIAILYVFDVQEVTRSSPIAREAATPDLLLGFDIFELAVELSAVTLAIVARPRWFGVR